MNRRWDDAYRQGMGVAAALALLAAAALMLTACSKAPAASADTQDVITWDFPTANTDGSALPLASIAKTTIVWGTASGGPYNAGTVDVTAPTKTATLTRTGPGTRCYKLNVTTTAAAGAMPGLFSVEGCKTVFATPNAPTNVVVQ